MKKSLAKSSVPQPLPKLRRAQNVVAGEAARRRLRQSAAAGEAAAKRRRLSLVSRLRSGVDQTRIFVLGSPLPAAVAQKFSVRASLADVEMVVVPRVTDLDTEELDEAGLRVWLAVVATGKTVIAKADVRADTTAASPACVRHLRATRNKCCLAITAGFAAACPRLIAALESYASAPGSKWRVSVGEADAERSATVVKALPDMRLFLRRARRLEPTRNHGTYCRRNVP